MQLNFKTFGSGYPLIILHGLFGMLDNWQTIAKRLADQYSVYIVDLRNHGKSPWNEGISYPEMADDLLHFMQDHWIYEAYIMGHSMGGKVAMEFALQHPDYCQKLISVDMGVKKHQSRHEYIFKALNALHLSSFSSRSEIVGQLLPKIGNEAVVQFLMKNIRRNKKNTGFELKMNLDAIVKNYDAILERISEDLIFEKPALFISGSESDYVLSGDHDEILSQFQAAAFSEVQGAGHWIHSDKSRELENQIRGFLSDQS